METSSRKERRGQRKPKKIQIETYANVLNEKEVTKGVLPKSHSREQTTDVDDTDNSTSDAPTEVNFFSGNPFVEQTNGILHLYKKK